MAILFPEVVNSGTTSGGSYGFTTPSWTPDASALYLLAVSTWWTTAQYNASEAVHSVSGNGATWSDVDAVAAPGNPGDETPRTGKLALFAAWMPPAPTTQLITVTLGNDFGQADAWALWKVTGAGVGLGDLVIQSVTGAAFGASSASIPLAAFADAINNVSLGVFARELGSVITVGAGFTELAQENKTTGNTMSLLAEHKTGEDLAVDCSWTGACAWGGIAVEIGLVAPIPGIPLSGTYSPTLTLRGKLG